MDTQFRIPITQPIDTEQEAFTRKYCDDIDRDDHYIFANKKQTWHEKNPPCKNNFSGHRFLMFSSFLNQGKLYGHCDYIELKDNKFHYHYKYITHCLLLENPENKKDEIFDYKRVYHDACPG